MPKIRIANKNLLNNLFQILIMEEIITAQAGVDPKYADIIELAKQRGLKVMKYRILKRYKNKDIFKIERAYINDGLLQENQKFTLVLIPEED